MASADLPDEQPTSATSRPHWQHARIEPASKAADRLIPLASHPWVQRAIGFGHRRAELLWVLAGAMLLQIAVHYAWRDTADVISEKQPVAPTAAPPVAAAVPSVPVQPSPPVAESSAVQQAGQTAGSPTSTEPRQPIAPASPVPPSSPETGTTTDPRDVPPWETWPNQPKAAEPASNQAASNSPARVSEPAEQRHSPDVSGGRPKSLARLKGTISKPQLEPTHEHARRSLY